MGIALILKPTSQHDLKFHTTMRALVHSSFETHTHRAKEGTKTAIYKG